MPSVLAVVRLMAKSKVVGCLDRKIGRFSQTFEYFVDIERSPAGSRRCGVSRRRLRPFELPGAIRDVPFRPWRLLPAGRVADVNLSQAGQQLYRRSNNDIGCAAFITAIAVIADAFKAVEAVAGFRIDFVKLTLDRPGRLP